MDYPTIKLKHYEYKKLSDLTIDQKNAIKVGPFGSQLKKESFVNFGYKVYGQENVITDNFKLGNRYIDENKFNDLKSNKLCSGDFLISMMGTIGKSATFPKDAEAGIIDSHLIRFRLDSDTCLNDYLKHLLQSEYVQRQVKQLSVGSIMSGLSASIVKQIEIPTPPINIQRYIISLFNMLDNRIERQKRKVELLKGQKKGLLQKIFSRELRFKDENGEEFPEWSTIPLNKLAKKITQKNTLLIKNVISNSATLGLVRQREYFDKDIANAENVGSYYVIKKGDFVYNPRISVHAPYGPVSMYTYDEQGVVSPLYLCFEVTSEQLNKDYLLCYFQSSAWHKHIYTNGDQGARHDRVSIKDSVFMELPLLLPSMGEQAKIVRLFTVLNDKIKKEEKRLKMLDKQKKGIMQQMFF